MQAFSLFLTIIIVFVLTSVSSLARAQTTISPTDAQVTPKQERLLLQQQLQKQRQTLKDERKKATLERIDAKLATVNKRRTNTMNEQLQKLNTILSRIQEKTNTQQSQGKDTSAVENAIRSATGAIATAQSAINLQSDRQYIVSIENESTLKANVGSTTKQLQADLKTTRKTLVDAKQAVQRALSLLKQLGNT